MSLAETLDEGLSPDFLDEMGEASRLRVRDATVGLDVLRRRAALVRPPPLRLDGFDVIAEIKLRSPSLGALHRSGTPPLGEVWSRARAYARGGAAAISVLTEPERFGGSLAQLTTASCAVKVPVMRKDFVVDPYQAWEARAAGAGGLLVIAQLLDDAALEAVLAAAREAGLFVLLEAFDREDLVRAAVCAAVHPEGAPPLLVGVNARDLRSLQVAPERLFELADALPGGVPAVAESGLHAAEDAAAVVRAGYRLALVGTAMMGHEHPARLVSDMLAAGRQEVACS